MTNAQSSHKSTADNKRKYTGDTIGEDSILIKKLYNRTFSGIVTGQSSKSFGNYASVDINQPKVAFAGNFIFKNGSVLAINGSGGISDNVLSLFTNSKFNSQFETGVQYDWLALSKDSIWYYDDTYRDYYAKKIQMVYEYKKKKLDLNYENRKQTLVRQDSALVKSIRINREKYNANDSKLSNASDDIASAVKEGVDTTSLHKTKIGLMVIKDSLTYRISLDSLDLETNSLKISKGLVNYRAILNDVENSYAPDSVKLNDLIEIFKVKFGWFSFGYHIKISQFKLFYPDSNYNKQVVKQSAVNHEAKIMYSVFKWSQEKFSSYYWNVSAGFTYGNNLEDLDPVEITEIKNYGPNPNDRTSSKKYNAYSGTYKTYLKGIRLYGEYYRFFFKDNAVAFHVFSDFVIKDKVQPTLDPGLGLIFSVKDAAKESSIVNVEFYYTFKDVFNTSGSEFSFWERNNIGIRFGFPIKYSTK
jgi:hypothetical protein